MPRADHIHVLLDIDELSQTGTCDSCGRVGLKRRSPRQPGSPVRWSCAVAEKARKALEKSGQYGLSPDELDQLKEGQGGACAICRCTPGTLYIDHDHSCCPGKRACGRCVRGLLCQQCNLALGLFGDDTAIMAAAIEYLRSA